MCAKRVAERAAQGTTSAGEGTQRYWAFLHDGEQFIQKPEHKSKVGFLQLSPFTPLHMDGCGYLSNFLGSACLCLKKFEQSEKFW